MFWEKRIDEKSYRDRRAWQSESGFHVITRKLTAVERKEHPWDLFMTHPLHGDIIVPGVLRLPLRKIRYLDIVEKILEANAAKRLSLRVLKELWVAIVEKVYDFEHDWLKVKRFEVCL